MKKMYKFYWDCGRSGDLNGLFIAEENDIKDLIGKHIYFGEVLGKHSDIYGNIDEGDIEELNVSENTINEMEKVCGKTISGYNPFDYLEEEEREREYGVKKIYFIR